MSDSAVPYRSAGFVIPGTGTKPGLQILVYLWSDITNVEQHVPRCGKSRPNIINIFSIYRFVTNSGAIWKRPIPGISRALFRILTLGKGFSTQQKPILPTTPFTHQQTPIPSRVYGQINVENLWPGFWWKKDAGSNGKGKCPYCITEPEKATPAHKTGLDNPVTTTEPFD